MFHLIEQLKLNDNDDNINQFTCHNCDNGESDENLKRASAAISSINHISQTRAFDILCVGMVLWVGMSKYVQGKAF